MFDRLHGTGELECGHSHKEGPDYCVEIQGGIILPVKSATQDQTRDVREYGGREVMEGDVRSGATVPISIRRDLKTNSVMTKARVLSNPVQVEV